MRPLSAQPFPRYQPVRVDSIPVREEEQTSSVFGKTKKRFAVRKAGETSGSGEFARLVPKTFYQDKEQLYGEVLSLKCKHNSILDQNVKLKTKVSVLEKQNLLIKKSMETGNNVMPQSQKLAVVKRLLDEYKGQCQYLKGQNLKMKRTVKYSNISQLQMDKTVLFEQTQRLRKMLDGFRGMKTDELTQLNYTSSLQRRVDKQTKTEKHLQSQNSTLIAKTEELKCEIEDVKRKAVEKENRMRKELAILKGQLVRAETPNKTEDTLPEKPGDASRGPTINLTSDRNKLLQQIASLKLANTQLGQRLNDCQCAKPQEVVGGINGVVTNYRPSQGPVVNKTQNRKVRTNSKTKLIPNQVEGMVIQTRSLKNQIQPSSKLLITGALQAGIGAQKGVTSNQKEQQHPAEPIHLKPQHQHTASKLSQLDASLVSNVFFGDTTSTKARICSPNEAQHKITDLNDNQVSSKGDTTKDGQNQAPLVSYQDKQQELYQQLFQDYKEQNQENLEEIPDEPNPIIQVPPCSLPPPAFQESHMSDPGEGNLSFSMGLDQKGEYHDISDGDIHI